MWPANKAALGHTAVNHEEANHAHNVQLVGSMCGAALAHPEHLRLAQP